MASDERGNVDLRDKAYASADAVIREHGWPATIDGAFDGRKVRTLLALAFVQGYGEGLRLMKREATRAFEQFAEEMAK
jgi:hypothetical protein